MLRIRATFAVLVAVALPAAAQDGSHFEVASLKPAQGSRSPVRPSPGGERLTGANVTLKSLILYAYQLRSDQVTGGPGWVELERYDLNAKADRPSTSGQLRVMLRNLLADQFHLQFHRATREGPVYVLALAPGGPKLTPSTGGDAVMQPSQASPFHMRWTARAAPMGHLAWQLGMALDRPVLDRTALPGSYDFELVYTAPIPSELAGTIDSSARPSSKPSASNWD